jgi:hypothetical protein
LKEKVSIFPKIHVEGEGGRTVIKVSLALPDLGSLALQALGVEHSMTYRPGVSIWEWEVSMMCKFQFTYQTGIGQS